MFILLVKSVEIIEVVVLLFKTLVVAIVVVSIGIDSIDTMVVCLLVYVKFCTKIGTINSLCNTSLLLLLLLVLLPPRNTYKLMYIFNIESKAFELNDDDDDLLLYALLSLTVTMSTELIVNRIRKVPKINFMLEKFFVQRKK